MSKPKHWSPSRLNMLAKCGQQYAFRYLDGITLAPSIASSKGTAIHETQKTNFRQKIESREDLPKSDLVDMAVEEFRTQAAGELAFLPEEVSKGTKIVIGEALDRTASLAGFWAEEVASDYQPKLVERWFRLSIPDSPDLVGVIDLLDDKHQLGDMKTTSKKKNQAEADESIQLTAYVAGTKKVTGRAPSAICLDTMVQTPGGKISRQKLTTTRDRLDLKALENRIRAANKVVESGAFMPAAPGSWWCSNKWCGYWNICPHVKGNQ